MIGDNIVEPLSLVTAAYAVGSALCGRVEFPPVVDRRPRRLASGGSPLI